MNGPALILGASGLLGSALMRRMLHGGLTVVAPPSTSLDIRDTSAVSEYILSIRPSVVVNAAGYTSVDGAERDRTAAADLNVGGAANIAGATAWIGAQLIHFSTDFVFPGDIRRPLVETDQTHSTNWYGATKLQAEEKVRVISPRHLIFRVSWLHGTTRRCFVSEVLRRLRKGETVFALNNRWASPTSVDDLADCLMPLLASLMAGARPATGTYHLAGQGAASPFEIAEAVRHSFGAPQGLVREISAPSWPEPAERPVYSALDIAAAGRSLDLTLPAWEDGISRTVRALIATSEKAA